MTAVLEGDRTCKVPGMAWRRGKAREQMVVLCPQCHMGMEELKGHKKRPKKKKINKYLKTNKNQMKQLKIKIHPTESC